MIAIALTLVLVFSAAAHAADSAFVQTALGEWRDASRWARQTKYDRWHEIVQRASLAFWDAYLLNKPDAKAYLTGGGFARDLDQDGRFEFKLQ